MAASVSGRRQGGSPALARRSVAHITQMRLDGAHAHRRLADWRPRIETITSQIVSGGYTVLARARDLAVNNGYAAQAIEVFASDLIGDGIKPSFLGDDQDLRKQKATAYAEWVDEADADGHLDFYGLQDLVAREVFEAGECFVRLRTRLLSDGLSVPLQLQVLQSEMLPLRLNRRLENGNEIKAGIEVNGIGKPVAYHFLKSHPGDHHVQGSTELDTVRVPAEFVCHVFRKRSAGQMRGLTHLAPAMVPMFVLDRYDDAELERKRTASLFGGFIKSPLGEAGSPLEQRADDGDLAEDYGPTGDISLEPGVLHRLLDGEDIVFSEPADVGTNYEAFQYRSLLRISSALGLPYWAVTGDLRETSYASMRAGMLQYRRQMSRLQHGVIAYQLCRRVVRMFMDQAVLSGRLIIPGYAQTWREHVRASYIPPRWEWVDPEKDINALKAAIDARITSRRKVVEATGYDVEEIDAEIAEDEKRLRGNSVGGNDGGENA